MTGYADINFQFDEFLQEVVNSKLAQLEQLHSTREGDHNMHKMSSTGVRPTEEIASCIIRDVNNSNHIIIENAKETFHEVSIYNVSIYCFIHSSYCHYSNSTIYLLLE